MTKLLLNLVVVSTILCMSCEAVAQSDIALATRKAELQTLSEKLKIRDANDRRQVQEFALRTGIPLRRELSNGTVLELQRIAPDIGPVFYVTNNVDAADTVSTDEVWPGGSAGLDLDGGGMTVGQWDGGAIYAAHPDFTGRLTQVDGATVVSNHSTHVAGTLIGAGEWLDPRSRGMAYAAHLDAYDWNSDTAEMALAASNGLLVSNHSYGIAAGWLYIGGPPPDNWWWIGGADPADVEDPNFGYYDNESQLWDQIAFDAPYYLIVKAVGNDRTDIGPSPGEEYTVIDQDGNFLFTSTLPRDADCAPAGYDCLPTNSVAKNALVVGAVDDVTGGYSPFSGPSSVQMAQFSGWGPTDDGRIKPDLVANGMFLISAWSESPFYAAAAGTSMAAPNVTGSLLLLQEHYQDLYGAGNFMRAATLKALAIHAADEAGSADGPDYAFGWGLLNTKSAAEVISGNGGAHQIIEDSLADGGVNSIEVIVSQANSTITATLNWTDPPGTPVPLNLDASDSMLLNDLDLRIRKVPSTYLPWVLNPAFPAAAATTGDNFRDNVEQVETGNVGTGSYFVEVSHKGALLNGNNQDYSLIISVTPSPPTGSSLIIDENFSAGLPAGWSVNTAWGINWTINAPVPGDSELDNLTGGGGNFAMVDNNYKVTNTSLQMPTFDLSSSGAVVLRFKSYFIFDFLETINVDISTDGGAVWTNVWQFLGFNPFPTQYVLDLSGAAAGQSSVTLRFRFDSAGDPQGNFWQVDDVELEVFGGGPPPPDPPGQVTSPNPADGASGLGAATTVSWSAGSLATSHDVYFGTSNPPGAPDFQVNQAGTSFDPGPLSLATTYYWRIDEVNDGGTTPGNTWSFTTEAGVAETMNLTGLSGSMIPGSRGRWSAAVEISVEDQGYSPEAGVTVDGSWSNGASGSASCVTTSGGICSVSKNKLKKQVSSVTFTVDNLTKNGMTYNPADNVGGDSIAVSQSGTEPPPTGERSVEVRPFKVKGKQQVEVTWLNFSGPTVDISRDTNLVATSPTSDGSYTDNIGVKGGGQTYTYQVCEAGTGNCASATAGF
ncbi:MAG: S8 family serine peptidase [Xanthomonadales bacterium]